MSRGPEVALGALLMTCLVVPLGGCGGSSRLQHQESVALRRTCQSLYERDHERLPPPLPHDFLWGYLKNPPRGFAGNSTRDQLHFVCDTLAGPSNLVPPLPTSMFEAPPERGTPTRHRRTPTTSTSAPTPTSGSAGPGAAAPTSTTSTTVGR